MINFKKLIFFLTWLQKTLCGQEFRGLSVFFRTPEEVIQVMVDAMNRHSYSEYVQTFTKENQDLMNADPNKTFREKSAQLLRLRELPGKEGLSIALVSPAELTKYKQVKVYYATLLFTVDRE